MLELLLAVGILAAIMVITFLSFAVVLKAWRKGVALMDDVHHGDFVMEQLVMGLRSAYYPDSGVSGEYGFLLDDKGEGEHTGDAISWVKQGSALVGQDASLAGGPHRVVFTVDDDDEGRRAAMVKAWRLQAQAEDFDSDQDVEPYALSPRVRGFNCRTAFEKDDDEID